MFKKYQISWPQWFVRDQESVKFHVDSNDYFGTLAAILCLLVQKPELIGHPALEEVKKDLLILQRDYAIVPAHHRQNEEAKKNAEGQAD